MKLIIFQGGAATGKTTLSKLVSKELKIALFSKDAYKEKVFDQAGKKLPFRTWYKLEKHSYQEVYDAIQKALENNSSLIIEGNFLRRHRRQLRKHIDPSVNILEVYCKANGWMMFKRYVVRNKTGNRHAGHLDHFWYWIVFLEGISALIGFRWYPRLGLSENTYTVDTTEFTKIDTEALLNFIQES